jgi:hypothetical protein
MEVKWIAGLDRVGAAMHVDVHVATVWETCRDGRCFRPQVVAGKGTGPGGVCPAIPAIRWGAGWADACAGYTFRLRTRE